MFSAYKKVNSIIIKWGIKMKHTIEEIDNDFKKYFKTFIEKFDLTKDECILFLKAYKNWIENTEVFENTLKSKLFDWSGKNIQWVRLSDGSIRKVLSVCELGITTSKIEVDNFDVNNVRANYFWNNIFEKNWQWSEDNKTWRKFE